MITNKVSLPVCRRLDITLWPPAHVDPSFTLNCTALFIMTPFYQNQYYLQQSELQLDQTARVSFCMVCEVKSINPHDSVTGLSLSSPSLDHFRFWPLLFRMLLISLCFSVLILILRIKCLFYHISDQCMRVMVVCEFTILRLFIAVTLSVINFLWKRLSLSSNKVT